MFPVWLGRLFLIIAPLWLAPAPAFAQHALRAHRCPFGPGEKIDARTCITLQPRSADRPARIEDASRDAASLRPYCPSLALSKRGAGGKPMRAGEVKLPEQSNLYDVSNCCLTFELKSDPATRRFQLTGMGRDCFGGTARSNIDETYALDRSGRAKLLRNATTFQ